MACNISVAPIGQLQQEEWRKKKSVRQFFTTVIKYYKHLQILFPLVSNYVNYSFSTIVCTLKLKLEMQSDIHSVLNSKSHFLQKTTRGSLHRHNVKIYSKLFSWKATPITKPSFIYQHPLLTGITLVTE